MCTADRNLDANYDHVGYKQENGDERFVGNYPADTAPAAQRDASACGEDDQTRPYQKC